MPRSFFVLDTSILISYFRRGEYRQFLLKGIRDHSVFLPGIVLTELFAGATRADDRKDLETFRKSMQDQVVGVSSQDWVLAGRCMALYASRFGKIRPRDHVADVLIAIAAARRKAILLSENIKDMERWKEILNSLKYRMQLQLPARDVDSA